MEINANVFYPCCPIESYTCPYYNAGICLIESPEQECEEYISYYEELQIDPE